MTSTQVKNQVRDSFEQGFDSLHRVADVVTFPLAPLDGAIHGTSRGVLNWLTDTHPRDRRRPQSNDPRGPEHAPYNGGGGYGSGYPAGIDPNRKVFDIDGNEITDNKADTVGISQFGNMHNGGSNGGSRNDNPVFGIRNNKMKGNEGKNIGISDFANGYGMGPKLL